MAESPEVTRSSIPAAAFIILVSTVVSILISVIFSRSGLFNLQHLLDQKLKHLVLILGLKPLNFLNPINSYMVLFARHGLELCLHRLQMQYLFPLLNHHLLLSLQHVVFSVELVLKSLVLRCQGLLHDLHWFTLSATSISLSLLNICPLVWSLGFLLICEDGCHIWLVQHFLQCTSWLNFVIFSSMLHFNFSRFSLVSSFFQQIFFCSRFLWFGLLVLRGSRCFISALKNLFISRYNCIWIRQFSNSSWHFALVICHITLFLRLSCPWCFPCLLWRLETNRCVQFDYLLFFAIEQDKMVSFQIRIGLTKLLVE